MPANVVTERNFNEVFPPEQRQRFWDRVKRSLDEVFETSSVTADLYRQEVEDAPVGEQILVYHDEPLKVAADLARVQTVSGAQLEKYRELVQSTEPAVVGLPDTP
jgi:hypothetical protein